jgi:DNA polymerase III subunit gamma/tau
MADAPFVSLYRRFRPGRFDELRGQDHVVQALRNAVRDDRVSHAYLFSGPRGTGKTSSARILAKALNCAAPVEGEPCGVCTSCTEITQGTSLDVHELDAASNNGVEAMRDLVAHASLGTPGRWKVYIVDEVHMLSTPAANALLKTLEEPPSHVVFVLATTDPQKVPPTIRSRTQHLEFRLLGAETLHDLLASVNQQAGLAMDEASVQAAVRRGRGSARDALSALDQVAASGSSDAARPELGAALTAMAASDTPAVLVTMSELLARGWGPQQLATELVDDLRQAFLAALAPELCAVSGPERGQFTTLAESMGLARVVRAMEVLGRALIDMREAPDPQVVLEIALVRTASPELDAGIDALTERVAALERTVSSGALPERPASRPAPSAPPAPAVAPAAASAPPVDVGRRPSLGAVQRSRQGATAEPESPSGPAPASPAPAPAAPAPAEQPAQPPAAAPAAPPAAPPPTSAAAAPSPPPPSSATSSAAIDRDSLSQAWGDGILRGLPARAKALYSGGRFVAVDQAGAQFALPNAAHRDRCAELVPQVEAALAQHFGSPITLVLVVDGGSAAAPPTAASSPDASGPPPRGGRPGAQAVEPDEVDEIDLDDLREATATDTDQASAAEARLLEAFPGASEVAE